MAWYRRKRWPLDWLGTMVVIPTAMAMLYSAGWVYLHLVHIVGKVVVDLMR